MPDPRNPNNVPEGAPAYVLTPRGTQLPLLYLAKKAKVNGQWVDMPPTPYLQVAHRLVWFREEHPRWQILPDLVHHEPGFAAVYQATIKDESGWVLATATGSESKADFADYLEKAETKAIGRVLALCGYGTQYAAAELDEGERLVDAPIQPAKQGNPQRKGQQKPPKSGERKASPQGGGSQGVWGQVQALARKLFRTAEEFQAWNGSPIPRELQALQELLARLEKLQAERQLETE